MSSQKSKNLHFDGLLLSKEYTFLDEKVQKSYISCHWRVMQSLRKNWLLVSKNDSRNLVNFNASSGKSGNVHFDVLLLSKEYYVWAKKEYIRVTCHNSEESCKIWGGTDLRIEKRHVKFGKFWPNTRKSQNVHFIGHLLTCTFFL